MITRTRAAAVMSLTAYIAVIVGANWMTSQFGLVSVVGLTVTAGTFAAGLALVFRDGVQVTLGRWVVLAAIAAGAILSSITSSPALAVASGIAFAASELVDFAVFTPLLKRSLPLAVITSSVVSAPVDTVLFLHLAGFDVTWSAIAGQFVVKTAIALLAAGWLARRR